MSPIYYRVQSLTSRMPKSYKIEYSIVSKTTVYIVNSKILSLYIVEYCWLKRTFKV